tara:strand:+ start:177 stop:347 length:171 start_codon:yes stop_codon:yes gene_type:complete
MGLAQVAQLPFARLAACSGNIPSKAACIAGDLGMSILLIIYAGQDGADFHCIAVAD